MPDRSTTPVYDKCTSCALASEKGSLYGPWLTSHTDMCCLYKFNQQEQSCHLKTDGLCKDCPSGLKLSQLQIEVPSQTSSDEGVPESCTLVKSKKPKSSKIAPRKRRGFSKLTIEIRPPKFKKKLWFGTWQEEEIDRAKDAINYYMGGKEEFILPDSQLIFARHPLGIEYRDLKPSCEEFLKVGQKQVRASVYFARRVKEVIKAVTRGSKKEKKVQPPPSRKPIIPKFPAPLSPPSSSVLPCASSSQTFSSGDDMVWYDASSEANSDLLPPPSYEGDIPMEPELFCLIDWREESYSLEGISFSSSPSVDDSGAFSSPLWS